MNMQGNSLQLHVFEVWSCERQIFQIFFFLFPFIDGNGTDWRVTRSEIIIGISKLNKHA